MTPSKLSKPSYVNPKFWQNAHAESHEYAAKEYSQGNFARAKFWQILSASDHKAMVFALENTQPATEEWRR